LAYLIAECRAKIFADRRQVVGEPRIGRVLAKGSLQPVRGCAPLRSEAADGEYPSGRRGCLPT